MVVASVSDRCWKEVPFPDGPWEGVLVDGQLGSWLAVILFGILGSYLFLHIWENIL